jgi:hypothetical protein
MKFSVLALDYDGTIARDNAIDPSVREAIAAARTNGVIVLLVTGRILDELRRVVGDLHFADGVVAENGAVVHFPDSGHTSTLAPSVSQRYLAELRKRRVAFQAGQCLVDGDAQDGGRLLDIIRGLELAGPALQPEPRHDAAAGCQQGDRTAGRARHDSTVAKEYPGYR